MRRRKNRLEKLFTKQEVLPYEPGTNKILPARIVFLFVLVGLLFVAMFVRLNYMIRVEGDSYSETASSKSTKTITLYGMRGTIYDKNMVPLAYDRRSYNVTFLRDPSRTNSDYRKQYTQILLETISIIESNGKNTVNDFWMRKDENNKWVFNSGSDSDAVEMTRKRQWTSNFALSRVPEEDWFTTLCTNYGIPDSLDDEMKVKVLALWQESRMNAYNSTPCTIAYDVGFESVSEIKVRSMDLDGIEIEESSSRVYPQGETACHIIGYISRINSAKLENYRNQGYPNDAFVGADGIENSLEEQLSPYIEYRQGYRTVEISTKGKVIRDLSYKAPVNGNSVVLTIDCELQDVMAEALADTIAEIYEKQSASISSSRWREKNADVLKEYTKNGTEIQRTSSGAMVAMDPNSGRVLGMVSYPTFNLSYFNGGVITGSNWARMQEGDDPLYNRAVSAKDSPGSIFKLCTSLAGLSEGVITLQTRIDDMGAFELSDSSKPPKCWTTHIENHKNQTVIEAIKNSCNYFFYTVGYGLGSTRIYKWAAALGLTSKTNIELPGETTSFVGNQQMLYDPTLDVYSQPTWKPFIAAMAIKNKLLEIAEERGTEYSDELIDTIINKILKVAVSYKTKAEWNRPIREILLYDLGLPESYIVAHYLGNTMVTYIQELYWTSNETVMLAIGQSITQVSPIAVARYVSAVANSGTVYDAQIVDKIIAPDGTIVLEKEPVVANHIVANEEYWQALRKGMEEVTSAEDGGTAAQYFEGVDYIAAKTGTSQRTELDVENNSWLVSYAPKDDPQIVVVVYIQNGYAGAYASPAAISTIKYYLESQGYTEDTEIGISYALAS